MSTSSNVFVLWSHHIKSIFEHITYLFYCLYSGDIYYNLINYISLTGSHTILIFHTVVSLSIFKMMSKTHFVNCHELYSIISECASEITSDSIDSEGKG